MKEFTIHNESSAPEESVQILEDYKKANGMIPNLFGVMAEAPGLLKSYISLHGAALNSSLSAEEVTVVWQTINVEHNCTYCVPAHTGVANMMNIDPQLTEALRNQEPMPTAKLQVLQDTVLAVVRKRGELEPREIENFYAAGYEQKHLLDIIMVLAQKVMSNYVNHIAATPTDSVFKKFAWEKK